MMSPTVSSEVERRCICGRSARATSLGVRGSLTSTAVKFFGALSCASHRIRRPSFASCSDMPSPIPPKPSSVLCPSSLKFQINVSLRLLPLSAISVPLARVTQQIIVGTWLDVAFDRAVRQLRDGAHGRLRDAPHRVAGVLGTHRYGAVRRAEQIGHRHLPNRTIVLVGFERYDAARKADKSGALPGFGHLDAVAHGAATI